MPRRQDGLNRSINGSVVAPEPEQGPNDDESEGGRARAVSSGSLKGLKEEEEDEDRVDARNAASRLATSTF